MKTVVLIVLLIISSCFFQSCTSWRVSAETPTPTNQNTNIGRRVKVLWGGSWYDATILDSRNSEYYIHYEGWSNSHNEWVTTDRVQFSSYYIGQWVEVEQRGIWYAAHIIQVNNNQYYIKYDGWSDSYNEWVTSDRVRPKQ